MNAPQRRQYDAIQQLANDEWPAEPIAETSDDDLPPAEQR